MSRSTAVKGTVYLVGAGPGDPELLTLRALRLLETADVVLHDDLVAPEVLALAGGEALITSVGKRCGRPRITQEGIHRLMVEAARAGQSVVRLKSGDPLVFGRAGEEMAALQAAGIPFEVVPGVTAALAAGASLALPLTDRRFASRLVLLTGRHAEKQGSPQEPIWQGAIPGDTTLVIYMPGRDLGRLQQELLGAGVAPETPCAAISQAATERQEYVAETLSQLHVLQCGPAPMLVVVGASVGGLLAENANARELLSIFGEVKTPAWSA